MKHLLEKLRHPLLRQLMAYLRELVRDHRDQVNGTHAHVAPRRLASSHMLPARQIFLPSTNN